MDKKYVKVGQSVKVPKVQGTITDRMRYGQIVMLTPDKKHCKVRIRHGRRRPQDLPFKVKDIELVTFPHDYEKPEQ